MLFPRSHSWRGGRGRTQTEVCLSQGRVPPPAWPLPARPSSSSSSSSCLREETARPPADIPFSLLPLSHTQGHELQAQAPGIHPVAPSASPSLSFPTWKAGAVPVPTGSDSEQPQAPTVAPSAAALPTGVGGPWPAHGRPEPLRLHRLREPPDLQLRLLLDAQWARLRSRGGSRSGGLLSQTGSPRLSPAGQWAL